MSTLAQKKEFNYLPYLTVELQHYKLFNKPLYRDFNCDGQPDCALILQNKKSKYDVNLYIIYSSADSLTKQKLNTDDITNTDAATSELSLDFCGNGQTCFQKLDFHCTGLLLQNWEYNILFEFDSSLKKFKETGEKHIGP